MNKIITSFFVIIMIIFAFSCKQSIFVFDAKADKNILDELLVRFKDNDEIKKIKISESEDLDYILDKYNSISEVDIVEPNYYFKISTIPNDAYYDHQWYLDKIKAPHAWSKVDQTNDVVIAVIDSGIQISHPDLKENIWVNENEIPDNKIDDDKNGFIDDYNGWDFINNTNDPSPKFEKDFTEAGVLHGTIVAGIAAASGNNNMGVTGVSWKSQIMPLRVLNDKGEGRTSEVIRAIDYSTNNGADIINLSFVGLGYSQALHEAIERAYKAGIIIVAAAGNEYIEGEGYNLDETSMYPVCHDGENGENMIIGVAATDAIDQKASFSSFGSRCIDIMAPGVSIFSTTIYDRNQYIDGNNFNKYYDGYWSGTSMATPIVSGSIALIEQANPFISRDKVVEYLLTGTDDVNRLNPSYIGKIGYGRLNVYNSVNRALSKTDNNSDTYLVVAPKHGHDSEVKITDIDGNVKGQFFAYNSNFRGGVNVATGDIDGDGVEEIITGAGFTGGPHVRIFDIDGNVKGQFFAYNSNFRGGVNVATGDIDGDGVEEIITGAGKGGGPQVRVFDEIGKVKSQFFAYNPAFRGGVNVACGNIDRGVRNIGEEIITSPGEGGGPHIRVFDDRADLKGEFFAYGDTYRGGVQIASGDIDNDNMAEIVTGTGSDSRAYVRSFNLDGKFFASFYAFSEEYQNGVNISVLEQ